MTRKMQTVQSVQSVQVEQPGQPQVLDGAVITTPWARHGVIF